MSRPSIVRSLQLNRRDLLKLVGTAAVSLAAPAIAQGLTSEFSFATNEWTLPQTARVLRRLTETFNQKHPDVRVREVAIPFAGFHDQLLTQLTAGTPPDLFRIDDPQLALYSERGYLTPLDAALKEAGVDPAGFVAAGQDARRTGQTLAIAYQTNARALFYNKQLLQAAGVTAPPSNAQEFESAIQRATSRERGVFGYALATKPGDSVGMFIYLMPLVLGYGAHFTTEDGKPNAADPRIVEGLGLAKRIWDGNSTPRGLDGVSALKLVTDGKIALSLNGSFVMNAAVPDVKPHMGAAPSPLPSGINVRASSWYGVAAQGRNKAAATAWLMHMLTPESQALIAEVERVVPALPQHIPPALFQDTPWYRTIVDGAARSVSYIPPGLGSKGFAQIKTISDSVEAILYRGTAIPTAMASLQKDLEANLR